MLIKNRVPTFTVLCFVLSSSYAGDMGTETPNYRPVGTLFGGVANLSPKANTYSFLDSDDDVFTYTRANHSKTTGSNRNPY